MDSSMYRSFKIVLLFLALTLSAHAQQWLALGPDGGDVRSLARDPHQPDRILLGTSAGQIYQSLDAGATWKRYVKLGEGHDLVIDHIIFHPSKMGRIYAATWSVEKTDGDLFMSADNGESWKTVKGMRGKSIRAFTMAPSNPDVLITGALDGVFRSNNGGEDWALISPPNHVDIRNIESVAVDPVDPLVIYAGTWHLPWKTSDGGLTWKIIKQGVIDDSDVFSIIIDPRNPAVVYASACSGIYKSENAGETFRKVQGIPSSARRTRVLLQDPVRSNIVYAGTTEGLWKTVDSGKVWKRVTGANIIVNDIIIDPQQPDKVMMATDRSGVMVSSDAGANFTASNRGFSHRQVTTLLVDRNDSSRIYAGLINDKDFGGVFNSTDSGRTWKQISNGLAGRDIYALRQSPSGEIVAGTNRGIFVYRASAKQPAQWRPINAVLNMVAKTTKKTKKAKPVTTRVAVKGEINSRVNDLDLLLGKWVAATTSGIYSSDDDGRTWSGGAVAGATDFVAVHAAGSQLLVAARKAVYVSSDGGAQWEKSTLPKEITAIFDIASDGKALFIAAREGAYRSDDNGMKWELLRRLPVNHLSSLTYDAASNTLVTTSHNSKDLYASTDSGKNWKKVSAGWLLRSVQSAHGRFLATTAFDGVVAEPDSRTSTTVNGGSQ